jgi:pro-kumamolisin-like protein/subtilase family protein
VPATRFCVRCGSPLAEDVEPVGFAASPGEGQDRPWVTTTLFPQLPRSSLRSFRVALGVGLALVLAATLLGAFPLAIVLAAVLVPVLAVIYVVDVQVYEDAPWRVLPLTVAWGIVAGVVVALVARWAAPDPADLLERTWGESLLVEGTLIPLLGLGLAALGPALLLLDRRFDDMLDGVTFGTVSGAWVAAVTVLVSASSFVQDGLRPGGSVFEWLLRLLVVAATPVVWASVVGAATGALWLRFRPSAHTRERLGVLGNPLVAFALAAVLLVANAVVQLTLPLPFALPVLAVLACIGLVWLRRSLQAGLLQEADAVEIGPEVACANCGAQTPRHTFCGACGIAARALPKTRGAEVGGASPARLRPSLVPAVLAVGLLVLGGVTTAAVLALAPTASALTCAPGEPCGGPPSDVPVIEDGAAWRSDDGVSVVYDQQRWSPAESGRRLELTSPDGTVWIEVETSAGTEADGEQTLDPAELPGQLRAVEPLDVPLHGPNVGYVAGAGAWYAGFLDSPQGPRASTTVARLTSRRRGVTVRATAVFFHTSDELFGEHANRSLRGEVDSILNTVRFGPSPVAEAAPVPGRSVAAPGKPAALGPTPADARVDLSLTLTLPRKDALRRYAAAVTDPTSDAYGRFLTAEGAGRRFGLPQRRIDDAVRRLERAGFEVVSASPQRTGLHVRASAERVNRFFGVTLGDFHRPDGSPYRRPGSPPRIPAALAGIVAGVVGLDTESRPRALQASPRTGLRPVDVAKAYEIEPLWEAGIRGEGQTVAIVALDSFRDEDIAAYDQLMGIEGAPKVQRVEASGVNVPVGANALEVSLDIEVVRAVAPRAQIVTFEAPLGWTGFVDALRAINADERIDVASVSFGKCLARVEPDVVAAMEQEHAVAVARGKTMFVASGDAGAFSCLHSESESNEASHVESVDWPAASPNVIGVGGTRLSLRRDRSYFAENGWEDALSNRGTGGGVSTKHKRPSWQRGPGVRNAYSKGGRRQVPDVAGPADCDSAFLIVYPELGERGLEQAVAPKGCGTSAAAPFWAGVAALALQYARREGARDPGFLGPALYDLARGNPRYPPFRDIQTGGNLLHRATPDWDYATGLGSPRAWNLARDLARSR